MNHIARWTKRLALRFSLHSRASPSWHSRRRAQPRLCHRQPRPPLRRPRPLTPNECGQGHDNSFVIGNDDVLAINVWKEPDVSRSIPVRSDGKISLPLVGEVQAAGQTPLKLEQEIAAKLQNFICEPEVTVIVQQINSQKFNVLGQVNRPGSYPDHEFADGARRDCRGRRLSRFRETEIHLHSAPKRRRHPGPAAL